MTYASSHCGRCPGICCRDAGCVDVSERDLARLAYGLGMSRDECLQKYTVPPDEVLTPEDLAHEPGPPEFVALLRRQGNGRQFPNPDDQTTGDYCVFARPENVGAVCSVYKHRPVTCREYDREACNMDGFEQVLRSRPMKNVRAVIEKYAWGDPKPEPDAQRQQRIRDQRLREFRALRLKVGDWIVEGDRFGGKIIKLDKGEGTAEYEFVAVKKGGRWQAAGKVAPKTQKVKRFDQVKKITGTPPWGDQTRTASSDLSKDVTQADRAAFKEHHKGTKGVDGVSLGKDDKGFFCYTHRARSKSKESPEKIPMKDVTFIESTGSASAFLRVIERHAKYPTDDVEDPKQEFKEEDQDIDETEHREPQENDTAMVLKKYAT